MKKINAVTDYVIMKAKLDEASVSLTHLKLQKILYYIQAWSLGINKKKMFDADFQAWVHGPVCREVYDRFSPCRSIYDEISQSDIRTPKDDFDKYLSEDEMAFIDYILENYLGFSGSELEEMTHQEAPWIEARKGVGKFERSEEVLSCETMLSYYGKKWEEISRKEP